MKKRNRMAVGIILVGILAVAAFFAIRWVNLTAMAEDTAGGGQEAAGPQEEEDGVPLPEQRIGSGWKKADKEAAGYGYTYLAMENNTIAFYVNENGNIGVLDKRNQKWYFSVPTEEQRNEDGIAKAINKVNLGSDYQMIFIDEAGGTASKNTLAGAVNDGNVRLVEAEGGLKVWYYVEDNDVAFSVLYQLTEDGFTVTLPFEDFVESEWGLRDISILPYFGAAGLEDEGYILIPDGSGALINFNNQKSSYSAYSQDVYGRDSVLALNKSLKTAKNVLMPVFGASFGDHGFFAVAEAGAASASINAMTSGRLTSYNNVYMTFKYRQSMSATRSVANSYGGNGVLGSTVVVDNNYSTPYYKLRYYLLKEDSADYVGMAECYRDYLISQGLTQRESAKEASLYLTLYGGIEDTGYFLGIPYSKVTTLTSYQEAKEILKELTEAGVDQMVVRYCGWQKDGLEAAIPSKVKLESALGGKKEFKALADYAEGNGISIFPDLDFLNLYESGNGYSIRSDAIQAATHDTAYQYTYDLNTGEKQEDYRWQLLSPNLSIQAFQKMLKQKEKLYVNNISLGGVGSLLYSDFTARKNAIHRDDTAVLWSQMLQEASGHFEGVMVETGNIYAAMYADYITNVSMESTHFNLADESVPFYQIVLHGYTSYATEPINLTADPGKTVLKALETGSNLEFSLIYGDSYELIETRYNFLFNASYEAWAKSIQEYYAEVKPVLSAVAGHVITGHERIADNVYRTDYESAGSVYVNYGKKDFAADGITVPAGSYIYLEAERR